MYQPREVVKLPGENTSGSFMVKILLLAAGGSVGTLFRYAISMWVQKILPSTFPSGTFSVNIIGSFLIGFCWYLSEGCHFSPHTKLFLFTGFFGGFTTFSSFSLETMNLMKTGDYRLALFNILASNLAGLIAVFSGYLLGKVTLTFN